MKFSKMLVTFTLRSGKEVKIKCTDISINKNGNDLVSYKLEGIVRPRDEDPLFYLRLDSIDHISLRRVFW
jgi:hypothetical protein